MRKYIVLLLLAAALGAGVWFGYGALSERGMLDAVFEIVKGLRPSAAGAARHGLSQPSAPRPASIALATQRRVDAIRPGMSRRDIEAVLGRPATVRTEPGTDGRPVQSANWLSGPDRIDVTFRDGKAMIIVASPCGPLPVASIEPPKKASDTGGGQGSQTVADTEPLEKGDTTDLHALLKDVEEKVQKHNEAIEEVLRGSGSGK